MNHDPRVDPQDGDFAQVGEEGREVVLGTRNTVTFRSSLDGTLTTLTIDAWRDWAAAARVFHTRSGGR